MLLLKRNYEIIKPYYYDDSKDCGEENGKWFKAKYIFREYPTGVRYVMFLDGGKNTKMAAAKVHIEFKL